MKKYKKRLVNKKDRNKYVDLMITYKNNIMIFELNNYFKRSFIRNTV